MTDKDLIRAQQRESPEYDEDQISIFRFRDADRKYRELFDNGDDEDWIALVPPGVQEHTWFWYDRNYYAPFGWCREYKTEEGLKVFIFPHSISWFVYSRSIKEISSGTQRLGRGGNDE